MRGHRGSWLGPWLLAAGLVVMPAVSTTVRAQPGFGPDPFWPYNSQYTPYTTNIGPASPAAGQGGAMVPRDGIRRANQFQSYLEGLQSQGQGEGRTTSDRASIGMPYYRAVDPAFDPNGTRQYRPNARPNASYEHAQRAVADKYLAYYSERDPARRAELMKQYRAARREASLTLSGRSRSPSRQLEPSSTPPASNRTRSQADRFGAAPEIPSMTSPRSSGSSSRRATPSDVLNRSRAMDGADRLPPPTRPLIARPRTRRAEQPGSSPPVGRPSTP